MFQRIAFCAALAGAVFMPCARAQFTANKITFRNPSGFTQADLEATAGVHAGEKLSLDGIRVAAQRLMDSEFFSDVKVDSAGPATALNVIFLLTPIPAGHLANVSFENLVWMTPEQARAALHTRIPLFEGKLPEPYDHLAEADAALAAALQAQGVVGAEVAHEAIQPSTANPVHTLVFRVSKPVVAVASIDLSGVQAPWGAQVLQTAMKLKGTIYAEGSAPGSTTSLLLKPLFDAGLLDARLTDLKITPEPEQDGHVPVRVTASVVPGEVYRVSAINFEGTPLVPAESFTSAAVLHAGDVASRAQLMRTLATIDATYQKQGYMDEYVRTGAVLDTVAHTVSYTLSVVPGEVYRLRAVNVQGLTPEAQAQFNMAWLLKPGTVYDAEYVRGFLGNNTAMRSLAGYTGSFQAAADPDTHVVDLTVVFVRVGRG